METDDEDEEKKKKGSGNIKKNIKKIDIYASTPKYGLCMPNDKNG